MRFLFITVVFLGLVSSSFSQNKEDFIQEDNTDVQALSSKNDTLKKRISTHVAIGSSVMFSGKNNYAFTTYVNPQISYALTPRFTVSMGLMAVQSNYNNFNYYNYSGRAENINYSGTSAYYTLQGSYLLSEKLKVYGGVMVGTNSMDFLGAPISNTSENKHNPRAYRLGFQYKIGEHASLQFEFQMHENNTLQDMQMRSGRGFGPMNHSSMFGPQMW